MALGLGTFGLEPHVFWGMTLPEFNAAIRGRLGLGTSATAPTRAELRDLMNRFPDAERTR